MAPVTKEKPDCHPLLAFKYFSSENLAFCITLLKIVADTYLLIDIQMRRNQQKRRDGNGNSDSDCNGDGG